MSSSSEAAPPAIPADVLSSLLSPGASSSTRPRPSVQSWAQVESAHETLVDKDGKNLVQIYCPREGCHCLILREGDAVWSPSRASMYDSNGPFPPPPPASSSSSSSPSPSLDAASSSVPSWLVSNSPMGFENVGFSRNVPASISTPSSIEKLKYLICADCDLGPLGWTVEGSKVAYLAVERVAYGSQAGPA